MVSTPEQLRDLAEAALDKSLSLDLGLSEEESDYNLQYITSKLARCSSYQEKLSDQSFNLTKIALSVTSALSNAKSSLSLEERRIRETSDYESVPKMFRKEYLDSLLGKYRDTVVEWTYTWNFLNEVRAAIADRIQLMKRMDSALRLHAKLLDTKVSSGAVSNHNLPTEMTFTADAPMDLNK